MSDFVLLNGKDVVRIRNALLALSRAVEGLNPDTAAAIGKSIEEINTCIGQEYPVVINRGPVTIDTEQCKLIVSGEEFTLDNKAIRVLYLLGLVPGAAYRRTLLIGVLWPEVSSAEKGRVSLSGALYRIKKVLGEESFQRLINVRRRGFISMNVPE